MKISNVDTYKTTVIQIEDENGNYFTVTHREDGDEYFIPVWMIEDEYNEIVLGDIRTQLIAIADEYLINNK